MLQALISRSGYTGYLRGEVSNVGYRCVAVPLHFAYAFRIGSTVDMLGLRTQDVPGEEATGAMCPHHECAQGKSIQLLLRASPNLSP